MSMLLGHQVGSTFFVAGGTLRQDSPCYVERRADRDLVESLLRGEFCSVLTSRQMGKSSLMVRAAATLRAKGCETAILDLTAIGLIVSPEQWYDGMVARIGNQLRLEDELEDYWMQNRSVGPLQRLMGSLSQVVSPKIRQRAAARGLSETSMPHLVVFVDEIDAVRSLSFSTDEFFAGILEFYNRRATDTEVGKITFCLLGAATSADLIRDPRITPFNIGRRIELCDFTEQDALVLVAGLEAATTDWNEPPVERSVTNPQLPSAAATFRRIFEWTSGHPYLTQRVCQAVLECVRTTSKRMEPVMVDGFVQQLFLSVAARERDDNLLYVRERILRTRKDLGEVLDLYRRIRSGEEVPDDEQSPLLDELHLAGIVKRVNGRIRVRNRIYESVFDSAWIEANRPEAFLERDNGERVPVKGLCNLGRVAANEVVIPSDRVSRRHAQVQLQEGNRFILVDLGSRNGTFLNRRRLLRPEVLYDGDLIEIGQNPLVFRQRNGPTRPNEPSSPSATDSESVTIIR